MASVIAPAQSPASQPARFPASYGRVLAMSCLALLAGIGVATWAERARYEEFSGSLQARSRTIAAGRNSRIAQILVEQGAVVAAGAPLLILQDDGLESALVQKQRDVIQLEAELKQTRARLVIELAWRKKELQSELFETRLKSAQYLKQQFSNQLESIVTASAARSVLESDTTSDSSDRWICSLMTISDRPDDRRTLSLLRQQAALNALEVASAQVELCDERLKELEQLIRDLPDSIRQSIGLDLVQGRLDRANADLAALQQKQQALTLVAEEKGLVGVFRKGVGDRVLAHEPIVQLIDEDQPYLLLQIPSRRIGDFPLETVVDLRFPGGKSGKGRLSQLPPQTAPDGSPLSTVTESFVIAQIEPAGVVWPSLPFGASVEVRRRKL